MRYVYDFAEGRKDDNDLLGGKGANLAEMTALGLPVPPGFTITTDACRAYRSDGKAPDGLRDDVREHLKASNGRWTAASATPCPTAAVGPIRGALLDARHDGDRPQRRTQRHHGRRARGRDRRRTLRVGLISPAAADVRTHRHGRPSVDVRHSVRESHRGRRRGRDVDLTAEQVPRGRGVLQDSHRRRRGKSFPQDPYQQLDEAVLAVFRSWDSDRARLYRRQEASTTTSAPRSTSWRWCSATAATTAAPASRSRATPPLVERVPTATTCPTRRVRTSSPAFATR